MPGQRSRRRRREAEQQRLAALTSPDAGRWELVLVTGDQEELRTQLRRLRQVGVDERMIRIDTLCGRLAAPTVHRLSRFVTNPERESGHEHSGP
ncbi:hypothetical protein [Streptomyces sp. NPDC059072]|uniref:hypothetical protein n=1 Tax=unclassified Streptomyces TaxID=2593676 RepID=UPI0036882E71